VPCERTPWSLLRCTLHVTVSRAIGCRFLSGVVVTSPTVITCSNGLTEEALWEGVLLPALLPACSLRSVFFSGRWPGPVGSFRSTAPHHNPPFLELATTSSPCQAMKLCESASNVELPLKPKSCWFQTELDDLDTWEPSIADVITYGIAVTLWRPNRGDADAPSLTRLIVASSNLSELRGCRKIDAL
jgi:hypothetical protein